MSVQIFDKWGDPYEQARRASRTDDVNPHGLAPQQIATIANKFEQHLPGQAAAHGYFGRASQAARFFDKLLPKGAYLTPGAGKGHAAAVRESVQRRKAQVWPGSSSMTDSGRVITSPQRPFMPESDSPDRQSYPVHRVLANTYWRLFYKLDAIFGMGVDMFAEMIWSKFQLSGEGVDGEIRDTLETMVETTRLLSVLMYMVRDFLVLGETTPHTFWDEGAGMWSHVALHNVDYLEVLDAPLLQMDPIVEFRPDDRLREVVMSTNPLVAPIRESMPSELLSALISGQNIPLSPINCTFIPRKLFFSDVRGTSIASRMWREFMLEDRIYSASIAVATRNAAPLKVALVGDPTTGYIPEPEVQNNLRDLLVNSELDPASWLVWDTHVKFDLVGTQERAWKIEQSSEFIERKKLLALGINKGVVFGEVTFAAANSGLTVMLQRLRGMREFFEDVWIYPKYFRQVSEMNGWIKPTDAELSHGVRTRRSKRELVEHKRYIMPKIEWDRPLDPSVDLSMINAMAALEDLGAKFSNTTKMSLANRRYKTELRQRVQDAVEEREVLAAHPELMLAQEPPGGGGAPGGGGGGGGVLPGLPPESVGLPPGEESAEPLPPAEPGAGEPPAASAGDDAAHGGTMVVDGWDKSEVRDLAAMLGGDEPEEEPWTRMITEWRSAAKKGDRTAVRTLRVWADGEALEVWEVVADWLLASGYPPKLVRSLAATLKPSGGQPDAAGTLHGQPNDMSEESLGVDYLTGVGRGV